MRPRGDHMALCNHLKGGWNKVAVRHFVNVTNTVICPGILSPVFFRENESVKLLIKSNIHYVLR